MFKSREIRWFTQTEDSAISKWFARNGQTFANTESRTDFYLPLPGKEDIGIKLREGNIEIKQRINQPEKGKISASAEGYFEDYIKWSFSTADEDELSREIIQKNRYEWLKVRKERMGFKLQETEEAKTSMVNISEYIPYGCQVEYTRISLNKKTWYSFGLEWFGPKIIKVEPGFIEEILGNSLFKPKESMGYAELLNKGLYSN